MYALILDDDPSIGRVMCRVAQAAGLSALSVTDAAAFQTRCRLAPPDAILLDLQIGDDDGIAQLRFLAAQHYSRPVILVSGFDRRVLAAAERLGRDLGLDIIASLVKPFRAEELTALFERLMRRPDVPTIEQLRDAIGTDQLVLEYQPIVEPAHRQLAQLEALVRWHHPIRGVLGPEQFVALAEQDSAVIDALTDWVLARAARDYCEFRDNGIETRMAINVSGANLASLDFPDRVQSILRDANIPHHLFSLELTESVALHHPTINVDVLARLRLKGSGLAIDDFGTGFSSFKLLRQLPFTTIKVDRSFVTNLAGSRDAQAIVKSIADLARNMELECIAEGVENQESAALLGDFGISRLQGFLYAAPKPVQELVAWQRLWCAA